MPPFDFDPAKSPEENIDAFFTYMGTVNVDFACLLQAHIGGLIPLPEDRQRQQIRQRINREIAQALATSGKEASA